MSFPSTLDAPAVRHAAGLAIGVVGGWVFSLIGTPIPWLLGSLLTVAAVNLLGWRITCPPGGRQSGQMGIGMVIGLYFTPAVAAIVVSQLPWMVMVAAASLAVGGIGAIVQARVAKLDPVTSFLSSVPGGMAEMIALADKLKGDQVALAVSQLTRVTIVVITVPAALTYLGEPGSDVFQPAIRDVNWSLLPLLMGGCVLTAIFLDRVRLTNAWMLGACIFGATLTVLEINLSAIPSPIINAAQVLIGVSVGQRFEREAMGRLPLVITGSVLTTIILLAVAVATAWGVHIATGIGFWSMLAATCPGGLAEMAVTAKVLSLGVPLVAAYHVTRIFMITLFAMPAYRLIERFSQKP